jgi:hypothetical protein
MEAFALAGYFDPAAYENAEGYDAVFGEYEEPMALYPTMPGQHDMDEKRQADQEFH